MKNSIITFIIFAVIVSTGIVEILYISKVGTNMENIVDDIKVSIEDNNFNKAMDDLKSIKAVWEKENGKWYMIMPHQDIEEIQRSIAVLEEYVKSEEETESLSEIARLKQLLKDIVGDVKIDIYNIA